MIDEMTKENTPVLDDNLVGFQLIRQDDKSKDVQIVARKDEKGDYPVMIFSFVNKAGENDTFALTRDEMAAVTFSLAREDQQSKLLNARFREYKEVPVRLVTVATRDIKKGDPVVIFRKEKVPIEFQYTNFK